jgi:hypothetical protein
MRGGRNMFDGAAKTGRVRSAAMPLSWAHVGIGIDRRFGSPWKPQQEQMPLQESGATG